MDYAKNYMNTVSLADRIREGATEGKTVKAAGGLGARESQKIAQSSQDVNFGTLRASYLNDIRDMFAPIAERSSVEELKGYLGESPLTSLRPERNPASWASAPMHEPISADITDDNVRQILDTIKGRESGGDYSVQNEKGSASGGYQFIDSTWKSLTSKYGVGTEYSSAKDAPSDVQDLVAAEYVKEILAQNDNDVTKVPLVWYTGNAAGQMSAEAIAVNNGLTAAEYQDKWLRAYGRNAGEAE